MRDFTKLLPLHSEKYVGENDLFLETFEADPLLSAAGNKPPMLFVHGAYTGSWMWSKCIPHFIKEGFQCYVMNMRGHYKSRSMDLTQITFEDYLQDIKEMIELVITESGASPVILGFSLGGILCQKIAETEKLAGLILIDSSISKEVNEIAPYDVLYEDNFEIVTPAPDRSECPTLDESEEDIVFQRKYLSMESSLALSACACWVKGGIGISIDSSMISCPSLVIKAVHSSEDDRRGRVEAEHLHAEYEGYWDTTHTGLLIGQRYQEIVNRILVWLKGISDFIYNSLS